MTESIMKEQTEQPLVSVITPCLNGEKYLDRYFTCILGQTWKNIELIFVDDGSTDRTEETALSYRDALEEKGYSFSFIHQDHAGQAAALNKGLAVFKGDYLFWPDADDHFSENYIQRLVEYLVEHRKTGVVQGSIVYIYENEPDRKPEIKHRKDNTTRNMFEDYVFQRDGLFGGFMIRAADFKEALPAGQIYESTTGQNWQMILPVCYRYDFSEVEGAYYYYCIHTDSHSNKAKDYPSKLQKTWLQKETVKQSILPIDMPEEEKKALFKRIDIDYTERRLSLAFEYSMKEDLLKEFSLLKQQTLPAKQYRRIYRRTKYPMYDLIYRSARWLKHLIIKKQTDI